MSTKQKNDNRYSVKIKYLLTYNGYKYTIIIKVLVARGVITINNRGVFLDSAKVGILTLIGLIFIFKIIGGFFNRIDFNFVALIIVVCAMAICTNLIIQEIRKIK